MRHRTHELQGCREELQRVRTELRREVFSRPTRRSDRLRVSSVVAADTASVAEPDVVNEDVEVDVDGVGVAGDAANANGGAFGSSDRRTAPQDDVDSVSFSAVSHSDATFELPDATGQQKQEAYRSRKRSRSVPFTGRVVRMFRNFVFIVKIDSPFSSIHISVLSLSV